MRLLEGDKNSKNMLIHGDNLATLAALKTGRLAKGAEVIYIDPPYNIGGDFGYKDTWKGRSEKMGSWTGSHGAFLDFMAPRLTAGKKLLTDDGVMFISICDEEYHRLKILMDQIWGEHNSLGTVVWDKGQGVAGRHLTVTHEYVLVYAKNKKKAPPLKSEKRGAHLIVKKARQLKRTGLPYRYAQKIFKSWIKQCKKQGIIGPGEVLYNKLHPKTFRPFRRGNGGAPPRGNPEARSHKKLKHPVTKKFCKVPPRGWLWSEKTLDKMSYSKSYTVGDGFVLAGEMCYGMDENSLPQSVVYLENYMKQVLPTVINATSGGQRDFPPGVTFSTPKPVDFLKQIINSYRRNNVTVLDFFAGSGSTAHAVHSLNQDDGGNRSWVMVEKMGETFHNVLLRRLRYVAGPGSFGVYELSTEA